MAGRSSLGGAVVAGDMTYLGFGLPFLLVIWLLPIFIGKAERLGLVDRPSGRKAHSRPTPTSAGLVFAPAALLTVPAVGIVDPTFLAPCVGALAALVLGAVDDRCGLPARIKLAAQGAIALATLAAFAPTDGSIWANGATSLAAGLPTAALEALTIVAAMNAVNLIDGLDGLAGTCSLVSLSVLAVALSACGAYDAAVAALLIASGLLGFLVYNLPPAKVFMGDSGSQFLGYSIGALVVLLLETPHSGLGLPGVGLALGLPLFDAIAVTLSRLRRKRLPFAADRNHLHHRLQDFGLTRPQILMLVGIAHLLVLGVLFALDASAHGYAALACLGILLAVRTTLPRAGAGSLPLARRVFAR